GARFASGRGSPRPPSRLSAIRSSAIRSGSGATRRAARSPSTPEGTPRFFAVHRYRPPAVVLALARSGDAGPQRLAQLPQLLADAGLLVDRRSVRRMRGVS